MSSYGFIFPKEGYSTSASVKNLAWRDDQQVFLASKRQTLTKQIPAGTNVTTQPYIFNLTTPFNGYFVYRSYIWAQWSGQSRTYLADNVAVVSFGGQSFLLFTYFYTDGQGTASLRFNFIATPGGSSTVDVDVTLTFSVYLCVQSILDNGTSQGTVSDNTPTGIMISLPGQDVQTANPLQCSLHSEYTALKNRKIGTIALTANTWTQVAHNFGYEPAYYGWFTGTFGGVSGISPFGGMPSMNGLMHADARVESYVTTDSLWLYASETCTAYYYLFADLAGKEGTVASDDYGEYGLIISQHGTDILNAKPHELNFCSKYPNFKVYRTPNGGGENIFPSTVIYPTQTTESISQDATTINFSDANSYGNKGEFWIASRETTNNEEWHWMYAPLARKTELNGTPLTEYSYDSEIEQGGLDIEIHVDGSTFTGHYDGHGNFTGNAKFEGDGGNRRFYYQNGGTWNACDWDYGLTSLWHISYGDCYTWYSGGTKWVECYYVHDGTPSAVMYSRMYYTQTTTYYEEKVRFTGSTGSAFTGCTRGIDGTTARAWSSGAYIVPVTMCYEIVTAPITTYNPAFMGWTQGVYEMGSAQSFPVIPDGNTTEYANLILNPSDHKYWLVFQRTFTGQNDPWITGSDLYIGPNVYIKTFYDELGT